MLPSPSPNGGIPRGESGIGSPLPSLAVVVHPRLAHAIVVRPTKMSRHVNVTSDNDLLAMTSGRMTSGRMTS
jgi:hypothetical protein